MARLLVRGGLGPGPDGAAVDLDAASGELFVLTGDSRDWGRRVLRRVAGLDPTLLEILLDDRPVHTLPPEDRGIGFIFSSGALFPHLSVEQNLEFGLRARGAPRVQIEERVAEAARICGVEAILKSSPAMLTLPERLRVAIARSLVRQPRILLLDDPFGSSSSSVRATLRDELVGLQRKTGLTMVAFVPESSDALAIAHYAALFAKNAVRQRGTPLQLYARPADRCVAGVVGSSPMNLLSLPVEQGRVTLGGMSLQVPEAAQIVLGLRPEALFLGAIPAPALKLPGRVDRVEFEGAGARVAVEVSGHRLWVHCEAQSLPREKAPVQLSIALGRVLLFSADTLGRAIEWEFPAPQPVEQMEAGRAAVHSEPMMMPPEPAPGDESVSMSAAPDPVPPGIPPAPESTVPSFAEALAPERFEAADEKTLPTPPSASERSDEERTLLDLAQASHVHEPAPPEKTPDWPREDTPREQGEPQAKLSPEETEPDRHLKSAVA